MQMKIEGTVIHQSHVSFKNKQSGEAVDYFVYTVACGNDVQQFNSKKDFASLLGQDAIITLEARQQAGTSLYTLKLRDVVERGDGDEAVIR